MIRSVVFLDQREKIETALCSHSFKSTGTYNISTGVLVLEIYTIMKVKYYPDFSLSVTEYSQSMSHKLNLKEDVKHFSRIPVRPVVIDVIPIWVQYQSKRF